MTPLCKYYVSSFPASQELYYVSTYSRRLVYRFEVIGLINSRFELLEKIKTKEKIKIKDIHLKCCD